MNKIMIADDELYPNNPDRTTLIYFPEPTIIVEFHNFDQDLYLDEAVDYNFYYQNSDKIYEYYKYHVIFTNKQDIKEELIEMINYFRKYLSILDKQIDKDNDTQIRINMN